MFRGLVSMSVNKGKTCNLYQHVAKLTGIQRRDCHVEVVQDMI